jgi:hypothetical protein
MPTCSGRHTMALTRRQRELFKEAEAIAALTKLDYNHRRELAALPRLAGDDPERLEQRQERRHLVGRRWVLGHGIGENFPKLKRV